METTDIAWTEGTWLNPPEAASAEGGHLLVTAREGSDLWRVTSYGFVHADGHALLVDLPEGSAAEVSFVCDFSGEFDQAGALVYGDDRTWTKTGVEFSDGLHQVGAVVTRDVSDWSTAPFPQWAGKEVTVRVSRRGDALTIRARADGEWHLVRLAPIDPTLAWRVGPYCCAPTRAGLEVRFTRFAMGPADAALHAEGH